MVPRMIQPNPAMSPDALTQEERNYLLGLYLADGYMRTEGGKGSRGKVYYFLQPNEGEMAERVVSLLGKASLKPHVYYYGNTIRVMACSSNLGEFFPSKKVLSENASARRKFFEDNGLLLSLENRVAFCAGLLDGDGSCKARLNKPQAANRNKRVSSIGSYSTHWSFCQIRYSFLVDYFREFVESLAPDSTGLFYRRGLLKGAYVRRRGREALLKAGIAIWSWKVRKWAESIQELIGERRRIREKETMERAERIGRIGMKLVDVAKMISVRRQLLGKWYRRGVLRATLVREGTNIGYLVIPWEEVERLKDTGSSIWLWGDRRHLVGRGCTRAGSRSAKWRAGRLPARHFFL